LTRSDDDALEALAERVAAILEQRQASPDDGWLRGADEIDGSEAIWAVFRGISRMVRLATASPLNGVQM
jgi:hypothetical protein